MSSVCTIYFHHLHSHPHWSLIIFIRKWNIWFNYIFNQILILWFFPPPHHPQLLSPLPPHFITSLLRLGLTCLFPPRLQHLLFHSWISIQFQAPHPNSLPTSILLCVGALFSCRKQINCGVSKCHSWPKSELNVANSPKVRGVSSPMTTEPDECRWKTECINVCHGHRGQWQRRMTSEDSWKDAGA